MEIISISSCGVTLYYYQQSMMSQRKEEYIIFDVEGLNQTKIITINKESITTKEEEEEEV